MPTSAHFNLPLFVMKRQNLSFSWPKTRFVAKFFIKMATKNNVNTLKICCLAKNPLFPFS
nr:MAG TPA: hypothetical protein [Bacteriophage sp.]